MLGDPRRESFTTLDWVGTIVAAFAGVGLLLFPLAGRSYAAMYRDFGSHEQLPALTKLATSGWFPTVLATVVVSCMVLGVFRPGTPLSVRRAWIVGAFLVGCAGFALCLVGTYLPVFALAGAVRPE